MVMEYMEHELKDLLEHLTPDEGLRQAEVVAPRGGMDGVGREGKMNCV